MKKVRIVVFLIAASFIATSAFAFVGEMTGQERILMAQRGNKGGKAKGQSDAGWKKTRDANREEMKGMMDEMKGLKKEDPDAWREMKREKKREMKQMRNQMREEWQGEKDAVLKKDKEDEQGDEMDDDDAEDEGSAGKKGKAKGKGKGKGKNK